MYLRLLRLLLNAIQDLGVQKNPTTLFSAVQSKESDLEHRLLQQKAAGYLEGRLIKVWFSLINEG